LSRRRAILRNDWARHWIPGDHWATSSFLTLSSIIVSIVTSILALETSLGPGSLSRSQTTDFDQSFEKQRLRLCDSEGDKREELTLGSCELVQDMRQSNDRNLRNYSRSVPLLESAPTEQPPVVRPDRRSSSVRSTEHEAICRAYKITRSDDENLTRGD
jgi:hypothetical protein